MDMGSKVDNNQMGRRKEEGFLSYLLAGWLLGALCLMREVKLCSLKE